MQAYGRVRHGRSKSRHAWHINADYLLHSHTSYMQTLVNKRAANDRSTPHSYTIAAHLHQRSHPRDVHELRTTRRAARNLTSICSTSSPQGKLANASSNSASLAAKSFLRPLLISLFSEDILASSQTRHHFLSVSRRSTKGIPMEQQSVCISARSLKETLQG